MPQKPLSRSRDEIDRAAHALLAETHALQARYPVAMLRAVVVGSREGRAEAGRVIDKDGGERQGEAEARGERLASSLARTPERNERGEEHCDAREDEVGIVDRAGRAGEEPAGERRARRAANREEPVEGEEQEGERHRLCVPGAGVEHERGSCHRGAAGEDSVIVVAEADR